MDTKPRITYFFVDEDGTEACSNSQPMRNNKNDGNYWVVVPKLKSDGSDVVELPFGTIESLFGKKLTWDDDPIFIMSN